MDLNNKFSGFKSAQRPSVGLALVFDISGFTNFFNKPDIQDYITHYINQIVDCVETNIWGGSDFWSNEEISETDELASIPSMRKFLGDGMLYVWEDNESKVLSDYENKLDLINRLWNLQRSMFRINRAMHDYIPVADLPMGIKFGIAQGTVFKLIENDGSIDYIGPCINLASRLVKYSPEINFIASARLNISKKYLEANGYMKIIALELRSFENEIVIVDKNDYGRVSEEDRKRLFRELDL